MQYPIQFNEDELKEKARTMRKDIVKATHAAGSGHPGGSLSATELFIVLYNSILRHDCDKPTHETRDRFILSKGHITPAYYSILARTGYFDPEELLSFRKFGHFLQGHPKKDLQHGIEIGGGSLGQNLSIAVGQALGLKKRFTKSPGTDTDADTPNLNIPRVFDMSSEGELQEGMMWEAIMSASHYKLNNLCIMVDYNRLQIDGRTEDVMEVAPLDKKFEAFGWNVIVLKDGHDLNEIYQAFKKFNLLSAGKAPATQEPDQPELDPTKPTAIIATTIKGKGISFMEDNPAWHGKAPNDKELAQAIYELNETKN